MFWFAVVIMCELLSCVFVVWGVLNEKKLIAFERRFFKKIRRKLLQKKRALCAEWLAECGLVAVEKEREQWKN